MNDFLRQKTERGFTIVEVLIAMLMISVITAGVTLAASSGGRLEQRRDLTSRMTAASERVYEHLRSNKDWLASCRRATVSSAPRTCAPFESLDADERARLARDSILGTSFVITSTATGIDNAGDGLGAGAAGTEPDRDGNADDFIRITISIGVDKGDQARLGNAKSLTVTSVINGSTNTENGALVVSFCGATNQVDERIQIASCPQRFTWLDMPDCGGEPGCAPRSLFSGLPPGNPLAASRMVAMEPLDPPALSIRLTKRGGEDNGRQYDGSAAVRVAAGSYRFADLPTGTYELSNYSLGGWIEWGTHHIPSTKQATVERNRTANALVTMKRPGASGAFTMRFDREVAERFLDAREATFTTPWIGECEEPSSVNSDTFGTRTADCTTPHLRITWTGGTSANAQFEGLDETATEYNSDGHYREIVTVKYITEVGRNQFIWNGAAGSATFSTQPAPNGRYTERARSGNGKATYTIPTPRWTTGVQMAPKYPAAGHNSAAAPTGSASISNVPLGLNEEITKLGSAQIGNVFQRYSPAGCDRRYQWVVPGGSFSGGSCSSLHYRGNNGECYTTMRSNWTGVAYNRHLGCAGVYWPPRNGTFVQPGNFVVQVCKQRESRVMNISEEEVVGYNDDAADGMQTPWPEYKVLMAGYGYQVFETGSTTVAGMTVEGKRVYKMERTAPQVKRFDLGCQSSPSVQRPLICPRLDDWSNCSEPFELTFPKTPGWGTTSNVDDGHRPINAGNSMTALGL
ncbi:MAG: hypothetical protein JWM90_1781 [Thermoleophilia bacterium]|nr:hypothetical protein [Thermoleophilia bacterium]